MSAIFNASLMQSTVDGSKLRHGRYQVSGVDTEIQNGSLVVAGSIMTGEEQVVVCGAPTAVTKAVYIVDQGEVIHKEDEVYGLDDYINAAGKNITLRKPIVGDKFEISAEGIDPLTVAADIAVGSVLTTKVGTLMEEKATAGGTESFVAEIKGTKVLGNELAGGRNITMYKCEVVKAL